MILLDNLKSWEIGTWKLSIQFFCESIIIAKQNVNQKREQGQARITCRAHDTSNA